MNENILIMYALVALAFTFVCLLVWTVVRIKRNRHFLLYGDLPDIDFGKQFQIATQLHRNLVNRSDQAFHERWMNDWREKRKESGTTLALFRAAGDVFTGGQSARRRHAEKDVEDATEVFLFVESQIDHASIMIKDHIQFCGALLNYGFQIMSAAERITNPHLKMSITRKSKSSSTPIGAITRRVDTLKAGRSRFVDAATAAGAGSVTALGLWGAVQIAGHASTGTAMAGLYGAAAHSAGWAWFGGGSLATGGGGMALGHLVLPGVGVAVGWAVLVTRFHKEALRLEKISANIHEVNEANINVLCQIIQTEDRYKTGIQKFRIKLRNLEREVKRSNKVLRRFGWASDWRRRRRHAKYGYYYTQAEMDCVERVASAMDSLLNELPSSSYANIS